MSATVKLFASDSTVVDLATTVSRVGPEGPSYLGGFTIPQSTGAFQLRLTDGVGGSRKWQQQIGFSDFSVAETVIFPFPIRFSNQIVCSTGSEGLASFCYVTE